MPDICAALAEAVDEDLVLDGELVAWGGDRLDFDALQTRMTAKANRLATLARERPASYVTFDLLPLRGHDLCDRPWHERRVQLEELTTGWSPPLQMPPVTTEVEEAKQWMTDYYPPASRASWPKRPTASPEALADTPVAGASSPA